VAAGVDVPGSRQRRPWRGRAGECNAGGHDTGGRVRRGQQSVAGAGGAPRGVGGWSAAVLDCGRIGFGRGGCRGGDGIWCGKVK
jgi:hypothetical protein